MYLREEVRRKLRDCYGPFPPRTPLNPRITGKVEREFYTIQKLIYESRPNYLVTANLYLPKTSRGRMPAVLGPCGHSTNGKAAAPYQQFSRNLARQGYVVLIYDPPSQGERLEYPRNEPGPTVGFGTHSHNQAGNQMTLLGQNFALWEAWDGIRGLDYLLSRDDVDSRYVGVTGNSGGGTQTSHLNALDDRFTMAAPNCFVTRFLYNLENEEPTDAEQIMPGVLAAGLDMADFFVAQMPRPTLLGGERNDFFDVRGLRETYEELRRLYAILGCEDHVQLYVGDETHGFHQGARENMYRFFNRHAGVNADPREPDRPIEEDHVLQVTPQGQVHLMGSARTSDFTAERAKALADQRKPLAGSDLAAAIEEYLALPARSKSPRYRVMRARRVWNDPPLNDYGFIVETETRIQALLHAIPLTGGPQYFFPNVEQATLYIPHRSSLQEILLGQARELEEEPIRFALDVRGIGDLTARTQKDRGDDFFHNYRSDYMYANHGLMLRESYAGRRVYDLLRVLDLFQTHGCRQIHLVGRGMGAITATLAAVVHPVVTRLTLYNALLSFHELTQDPRYTWPLSCMVFGVLERFDLPDCLRELMHSKRLTVFDPWNSRMQAWTADDLGLHLKQLDLPALPVRWTS
jgi:dienelactone hydrolase